MKITKLETVRVAERANLLWVLVHTDEGITGLGETFYGAETVEAYVHEYIAPRVIGRDPLQIDLLAQDLVGYLGFRSSGAEVRGNSAFDIALWDIFGKATNQPIAQLLGGFVGVAHGIGRRFVVGNAQGLLVFGGKGLVGLRHRIECQSRAGSGNQGVTATIPVVAYARAHSIAEMPMLRAVALSHLVTMYLTCYLGYLSALCGVAIKAGTGAACGLTYLIGGETKEIERAVKIMAASLTGMICDGAKAGCALKVSTAADMALRAANMAMHEAEVPSDNGIVGGTADETIRHLAELNRSMGRLDEAIVEIMLSKGAMRA